LKNINTAKRKTQKFKSKFGQRVPRTVSEAYDFDFMNNNTKWKDAMDKEIKVLVNVHECFTVLKKGESPPNTHDRIPLIWAFDIKVHGRYCPRLVAGGHMTADDPEG
jgi:hypothetical protein